MSGKGSKLLTLTPQFSTWREYYTNLFHNKGIHKSLVDNLLDHHRVEAFVELICFILDRPTMTDTEFSPEFLRPTVNTIQLTPGFRTSELELCIGGLLFAEQRNISPNTDLLYRILAAFISSSPPYEVIDVFRILRSRAEWYSGDEFRQAYQNSPLHAYKEKIASYPYHLISLETPRDLIGSFVLQLAFGVQTQQIENRRGIRRIDPLYQPGDHLNNWLGTADDSKTFYDIIHEDTPTEMGVQKPSHWSLLNQRIVLDIHNLLASTGLDGYFSVFGPDAQPVKVAPTDSPFNPQSPHPYLPKIIVKRLVSYEMHIVRLCHAFLYHDQINTITTKLNEMGDNDDGSKEALEKELFVYQEYQSNSREMFLYLLLNHGIYIFTPFQIAISYVIARQFNDEELLTLFKNTFDVDETNWFCYTSQKRHEMMADPELDIFYQDLADEELFPAHDADVTPVSFLSGSFLHFCRLKPVFQPLFKFLTDNTKAHSPELFPQAIVQVDTEEKVDSEEKVATEEKEEKGSDVVVDEKDAKKEGSDEVTAEDNKEEGDKPEEDAVAKSEEVIEDKKEDDVVDGEKTTEKDGDDKDTKEVVEEKSEITPETDSTSKVNEQVETPTQLTIDQYPELNWFFSKIPFTFHDLLPVPDGQNYIRYLINNRSIVSSSFEMIFALPDEVLQILMGSKNDMAEVYASCFQTIARGAARTPDQALKWVQLLVTRYRQYQAAKSKPVKEAKDGTKAKKGTTATKGKKVSMMDKMKNLATQSQKAPELKFQLEFSDYLGLIQRQAEYYVYLYHQDAYNQHSFDFIQYLLDENLVVSFEKAKVGEVSRPLSKLFRSSHLANLHIPLQWQLQVKKAHSHLFKLATPAFLDTVLGTIKEPFFGEPLGALIPSGLIDVAEHICTTFPKHFKVSSCGLYVYVLLYNKFYDLRDYVHVPDIDVLMPQPTEFDGTTTSRFSIYKSQQLLQFVPKGTISDSNLHTLFPGFFNYTKQSKDDTTVKLFDITSKSSFERYSPPTFEVQFPKLNPAFMSVQIGLFDMTFGELMESAGQPITPGEPHHMQLMEIIRRRAFGIPAEEAFPGSYDDDNTIRTKHSLTPEEFSVLERPQCPWVPFLHMNTKPISFNTDTNQIIYSTPQVRQYEEFDQYGSPLHFYTTTIKDDNDTTITFANQGIIVNDKNNNREEVRNAQIQRGANYLIKLFELNNNNPDPEMRSPSLSILEHIYYAFHPNEINFKKKYANRASKWKGSFLLEKGENLTKDNYIDMCSWINNTTPLFYNIAKGFQPQIFQNELYITGAYMSAPKRTERGLLTQRDIFTTEIVNILGAADYANQEHYVGDGEEEDLQPVTDTKLQLYTICEKYATFITENKETQEFLKNKAEYLSYCYNEELNPGFKVKPIFSLLQLNTAPSQYDLTKYSFQSPHVDEEGPEEEEQQQDNDEDDDYYTAPTSTVKEIQPSERTGLISFNGYDADHIVSRYRHYLINAPTYLVWDFQQFFNSPTIESVQNPTTREHPYLSATLSNPNDSHLDNNIIDYNTDQYSIINCLATSIDQYGCVIGQSDARPKYMEFRAQTAKLREKIDEDLAAGKEVDEPYPLKSENTYTQYFPSEVNWIPYLYQHCHGGQHIPHFIIYSFGFWMALAGFSHHAMLPDLQLHLLNGSLQLYDRQQPRSLVLSPQFNLPNEELKMCVGLTVALFHKESEAAMKTGALIDQRVELFMKAMQAFGQEVQDNEEKEKAEEEQKLEEATASSSSLTTILGIGAVIGSAIAIGTGLYYYFNKKSTPKTSSSTTTTPSTSPTIEVVSTQPSELPTTPQ